MNIIKIKLLSVSDLDKCGSLASNMLVVRQNAANKLPLVLHQLVRKHDLVHEAVDLEHVGALAGVLGGDEVVHSLVNGMGHFKRAP